jgi:kinesin family protein 2/24
MEEEKKVKLEKEAYNEAAGKMGDVDFELMIEKSRQQLKPALRFLSPEHLKIIVCARKRPIFKKELANKEVDCITAKNPKMYVHQCNYKVDGITKYLENHCFEFDNAFCETNTSQDFYRYSVQPLINLLFNKGTVTCFAYGQTGSGKTYTMVDVQRYAIEDLFSASQGKYKFGVSFFEIYGGKVLDLLNNRAQLAVLEDKNQKIQVQGLQERPVSTPQDMIKIIEFANSVRTTCATTSNDTSSRSHAICHIFIKDGSHRIGKLSLVDLAGSERAQDCQSNNRARRLEGAEINKSLLSLKECIRALDTKESHVPFRASKLTMVLRDSFIGKGDSIRIVMIACVSPGVSSADHTINTLRYAERLKERTGLDYEKLLSQQKQEPAKIGPIKKMEKVEKEDSDDDVAAPIEDIEKNKESCEKLI